MCSEYNLSCPDLGRYCTFSCHCISNHMVQWINAVPGKCSIMELVQNDSTAAVHKCCYPVDHTCGWACSHA
jgi:hypothetical protein